VAEFIRKWRDQVAGAALFTVAVILFFPTTSFDFQVTWDDGAYVLNNPHITGFTLANLISLFDRPYVGLYNPVQMLTYMVDYKVWGLNPFGYHLSNVLIHSANVVLAFFVLHRLTGEFMLAFFAALMFAVHPLNVENIAWIAERKTLVSAFFVLASLLFYLRYRASGHGRRGSYAVSLVLFLFAVFAKGTVMGLSMVLLCHEGLFREKGERNFRHLIPFVVISLLAAGATLWATLGTKVVGGGLDITPEFLFGRVYPTMLPIWWEYIRLLIFPTGLSAYYIPIVRGSFFDPVVLAAILGWIVVLERIFFRASRQVKFWFLWAVFFFAPTSGLIPWVVYYADRYMYLPGIGFYVMAGMGATWMYRRFTVNRPKSEVTGNRVALIGMAAIAFVYGSLAYQRSAVWETELTLWQDTTVKSPEFSDGHLNLGAANLRAGRLDEAETAYRRAHELGNPKGEVGLWAVDERRRRQP
jgi:hypothetical protein